MTIEMLKSFFLWCAILNTAVLVIWMLMFKFMHNFIFKFHSKWFKFSREKFDSIHYSGMMFLKIFLYVFNIVPYIALLIISSNNHQFKMRINGSFL